MSLLPIMYNDHNGPSTRSVPKDNARCASACRCPPVLGCVPYHRERMLVPGQFHSEWLLGTVRASDYEPWIYPPLARRRIIAENRHCPHFRA